MARSKRDVQQGVTFTSDNVLRVSQAPKAVDMETAMVQTKTKVLNKPRTPKVVKKKTGPKTGTKPKKKHIYEPNTVPLLEIRKHQNGQHENRTKHLDLVPTQLLMEIVTEVGGDMKKDLRFQQSALGALQAAAESFYVKHLEVGKMCAGHVGRMVVKEEDWKLAVTLAKGLMGQKGL